MSILNSLDFSYPRFTDTVETDIFDQVYTMAFGLYTWCPNNTNVIITHFLKPGT